MIKLYGSIVSRATRNLWMLEELDVAYEHISLDWGKQENRSPEYLNINPAGKVPTLVDGDAVISESLAINLYLAQKYGTGGLWPDDDAGRGRCIQWSLWAAAELEPVAYTRLREVVFKREDERDQDLLEDTAERAAPLMTLLVQSFAGEYLTGDVFTVADLNVACVMEYLERTDFDMTPWPGVAAWYARTYGRPANQKVQNARAPAAAEMMKQIRGAA